ncbi:MAG: hypothetical protein WEA36_07310 [Balneolaceae bacterium]
MGQQQLLLVMLVTIIVGIATVVAINTFGQAADSATLDATRQDMVTIAASAQGYWMKPVMLGGGSRSFENIDFTHLVFGGTLGETEDATNPLEATNENATYTISDSGSEEFLITAAINDSEGRFIAARVCSNAIRMGIVGEGSAPAPAACTEEEEV